MKNTIRGAIATGLLMLTMAASAELPIPSGQYGLDKSHGYITFSYSHLGFSNPHVGFDDFDVSLDLDSAAPEDSRLEVVINASSINSRVAKFNRHLNGADYFDTDNHPVITFKSTHMEAKGDNSFAVHGNLTIKDISKPVTLMATINKAAPHPMRKVATIGVSATATVLRSEWGLTRALPVVSDEVVLEIEVELPLTEAS